MSCRGKTIHAEDDFNWRDFLELVKRERDWFEFLMSIASHRAEHFSRGEDVFADEIHRVIAEMLRAHARELRN